MRSLTDPEAEDEEATIVALGDEDALVSGWSCGLGVQLSIVFRIPTYPKEITAVAKARGGEPLALAFVHLPLFERAIIRVWLDDGGPRPLAARQRAG